MLNNHARIPPHHRTTSFNNHILTTMQSHEGILPFRQTNAAVHEPTRQNTRKDRARVFARLFQGGTFHVPPVRGSNVVVTVSEEEVGCKTLARVLYLLGTYYSLFVLLYIKNDVTNDEKDTQERIKKNDENEYEHKKTRVGLLIQALRCERKTEEKEDAEEYGKVVGTTTSLSRMTASPLPEEVLPSHRIVANASVFGRVAFVRQLPRKPELVLDYDGEVKTQLGRFGFSVILYTQRKGEIGKVVVSGIGNTFFS